MTCKVKAQHIEVMEAIGGVKNAVGEVYGEILTVNRNVLNIQVYLEQMKADIQNQLDKISAQLTTYLKQIQRDLQGFRVEMRDHLAGVNTKIDQVIDSIDDLKGDVNALQNDVDWLTLNIISQELNDNMNAINSFLLEYGAAANLEQAQSLAESYVGKHSEIVLNFIDAAIEMQEYAVAADRGDMYTDWVSEETANSLAVKIRYTVELEGGGTDGPHYFDYTNPKKTLKISYGNLEYLYKIFMTRFIINHLLYTGYDLEQANSNIASTYTGLLSSSGIKDAFEATFTDMDDTYQGHIDMIDSNFAPYEPAMDNVVIEKYDEGSGWSEIGDLDTLSLDQIKDEVTDAYIHTFVDYIGPYAAELISMEVDLRAYMAE